MHETWAFRFHAALIIFIGWTGFTVHLWLVVHGALSHPIGTALIRDLSNLDHVKRMLVKLTMEEWYRCRSSKTIGDFTEQICWKTTDTEPSGLHGRVHHEDILSQTITLKMKKDDKLKSENNATAKNLDEEMFVDCIEKIGHHISLVEQQNLVQWIFHINWGMQKLDEFFGTLLNMKNEPKVYMKDDEYNSKIQNVTS
ncbi:unnamed protein product [Citrullus colocynthis]|uniref:Uncharacterized protein n=1 Tax=Citrullus colocynthis TaxID=252529 RepID=A0ABP0YNY6_9ROSI